MANNITTSELDFDAIKENLKTFLQSQDKFKDYDFEGAGMNVIMDLLAYNTHYNALYTNLAVNESFLDSASKRSSVVSRAKEVGYIPKSSTASRAVVNITVKTTTTTPTSLTIPAYNQFETTIAGNSYTFYNTSAVTAYISNNQYVFTNVELIEGTPLNYSYTVADGTRYILPNSNIDLDTLTVRVQENASSATFNTYIRSEDILNLNATSQVYFVKEIEGQLYELEFGNDVVGKGLKSGNVVNMRYLTTNKDMANGARIFAYNGSTLLGGVVQVSTVTASYGGSDIEDIEAIRYNAPRAYTAQNRAVTVDDYKSIIYRKFPEADAVNVWGGEDNIPPQYGKVFISIKPKTTTVLTDNQKYYINNSILKPNNVVSITPVLVDPVYINVQVNATVYYNPRRTKLSATEISNVVTQTIRDYNSTYLNSFNGVLKFSKLSTAIDAAEDSIVSNITTIKLHREVIPEYDIEKNYEISLGNPIYCAGVPEDSILSTGFYIYGREEVVYLSDLPINTTQGILRMFSKNEDGSRNYIKNLGTVDSPNVDYVNGIINMPGLYVVGVDLTDASANTTYSGWELQIKPQSNDAISIRHQLVTIPDGNINVETKIDTVAMGDMAGGANYNFTSSRN
jgi:hypothetical protein